MERRVNTGIALVLLAFLTLACSGRQPKQPLNWHVTLEIDNSVADGESTQRVVTILKSRLDALGVSNCEVQLQGTPPSERIKVNLPKVADRERLKKVLSAEGRLELAHVVSPPNPEPFQTYESKQAAEDSLGGSVPANRRVLPYSERADLLAVNTTSGTTAAHERWVVVESPAIVDGGDLRDARATRGYSDSEDYEIQFTLGPSGAEKFGQWSSRNVNEYMAVILNGEVKSVVFIKSQISDQGAISGKFTKQSAEDMALILRTGALPKVRIVEEGPNN